MNKFWLYDLLLLDILSKRNELGASIFGQMFQKNHPTKILKFLDEETTFLEDLSSYIITLAKTSSSYQRKCFV